MSFPLEHFTYKKGALHAESVAISKIVEQTGSPVYIYSSAGFTQQYQELSRGLKSLDHMICFAVKSNSNLSILKLLSDLGAGVDLVSVGELYRSQIAGVPAQRVVFSGVGKTAQEMAQAVELGIFSFNVESSPELDVLNEVAISLGKRARVALRFNPDVNAKTHPYISTGLKKNKFGMNRKEILAVARDFKNYEALDLVGLSIHIGSQLLNLKPLSDAFDRVSELAAELDLLLESPLEFLDLGGGLGIRYDQEKSVSIRDYTRLICKKFKKAKKKILIEPGRTIAGNSGILVTETVFRKTRDQKDFLVVDAAMNDLLRPALYQSFHGIVPVSERHTQKSAKKKKTDIVGPVCETSDCFASDRLMSTELTTGDQVAILSCGAYGFSMSSNYNTRPRPAEVLVDGSKFRVIRQRETLEDLIRHELV